LVEYKDLAVRKCHQSVRKQIASLQKEKKRKKYRKKKQRRQKRKMKNMNLRKK